MSKNLMMTRNRFFCLFFVSIMLFAAVLCSADEADPLTQGFQTPPDSAKLWAYWWWLNGNVTKESITRDITGMKEKGFGGAIIFDADGSNQDGNTRVPAGPMFGSDQWRELYRHTLQEADRLGISISLNIQSGWNFGAPFIQPKHAAKHVTFSEITVSGPGMVEVDLPQPRTVNNFYRDIVVLALPLKTASSQGDGVKLTVSASSSQNEFPPKNTIDGQPETYWVSNGNDSRKPLNHNAPEFLLLDFENPVFVDAVYFQPRSGYGPKESELQVLENDGKTWKTLQKSQSKSDTATRLNFARTQGKTFRLLVTDSYDPRFPQTPRNVQIAEITLFDGDKPLGRPPVAVPRLRDYHSKIADREVGFSVPDCLPLMLDEPMVPGEEDAKVSDVLVSPGKMDNNGKLRWDVPEGQWTVIRFGYTQSGSRVSTASGDWQGYTLDYLDPEAFQMYWDTAVQPLIDDAGPLAGKALRYIHTDSWEAGGMNWSQTFLEEFRKRRDYDPTPYLPIVAGKILDNREVSNRFLNDFRRTIGDCIKDNHYALMQDLAEKYDIGIHPESGGPHGGPLDSLQLLGLSDIPMSEFWSWSPRHRVGDVNRFFLKQPATAAHTYGRKIVAAEGFTNIGMHWQESFSDNLKPSFDQALCEGMNLLVWHTFTSSPKEMGMPGQEYFAGTHFNTNNFVFQKSEDFLKYINRSQFLLQQGLFVADVLEYYGENVPNFTQMKWANTAKSLPGYDYDVATEEVLLERMNVKNGTIFLADGTQYKILVLPNRNSISLPVLEKLEGWVTQHGLTLIGPKPERISGLMETSDAEVKEIAEKLWGNDHSPTGVRKVGKGRVAWGITSHDLLKQDLLPFDFERVEGTSATPRMDSIHRVLYKNQTQAINLAKFADFSPKATGTAAADFESGVDAHIYFTANLSAEPDATVCAFRVTGKQPEFWNPLTGEIRDAKAFTQKNGRTFVPIDFTGHGSIFVVFRKTISNTLNGTAESNTPKTLQTLEITGPWSVTFPHFGGNPETREFDTLTFWDENERESVKHFSGVATYEKTFDFPENLSPGKRYTLQFGDVAEIADVYLNGKSLGSVWAKPYRLDVTPALKSGQNTLKIEVANHWANRLIADAALPVEQRQTRTNIQKITPQTPLVPSGLRGPVVIETVE